MNNASRLPLLAVLILGGVACSDAGDANGGAGGGSSAMAGSSSMAGTPSTPSGGSGNTGGSLTNVPLAGSGQAVGGGDQGMLFPPDGSVPIMPVEMGGSGGSGGGKAIPGDGNMFTSMIRGSINGTATFTQKGEDVELVVSLNSGCADGNHQFRIHDGYSCDSASTEGMPWSRGTGIGPAEGIACSGGKGMLMYTRSGADKTKNWTVGDHVQETDLTAHVVIVSDEKDPNSRASCGNFF
jgi:hypothetical protein